MTVPANTRSAPRRSLRFNDFNAIRRDLEALEAAHIAGRLTTSGNWTPGQNLAHLAAFANYPYDGYPSEIANPPWLVRFACGFMKKKLIHKHMSPGVKIPGIPSGTVGAANVPFETGLHTFRAALDRMEKTPPTIKNPILGRLTHEEWMQMQCRHAELHLGFLKLD
ncbi:MAG: DUF1569 domain-containing protein [Phycisphaerales bacterium]|nr:DUF1569 domain-containing protein [Phycisphaerales bacterium]